LLRMKDTRIPKFMYEYIPTGKRDVGRPRKRWTDKHPWRCNKCGMT